MSRAQRTALAVALVGVYAVMLGILHVVPRYDCLIFPVLAWFVFKLLDGAPQRQLAAALGAIGLLLSFAILTHLWTTGHEGRAALLAGIIPASDAGQFTLDAERIQYGLGIAEATRRPLFVVVDGALLRWLGNNLRATLILFTALFGLAHAYMTWETMRAHGRVAGFIVFFVAWFWVRRFTGVVGTEDISFPPGAIAFGLLLRAADLAIPRPRQAMKAFAVGLLCLSLALAARPGPLLIMPALLAWAYYAFRGRARYEAVVAGALGIGVAYVALRVITARFSHGEAFTDFPNIAYSLLHRCDLHCAVARHPDIGELPHDEIPVAMMALVRHDIGAEPWLLLTGPLDAFFSFVFGAHGWFGFMWNTPDDHVWQDAKLMKAIIAEHGYLGPVSYWIEKQGVRSLVNAAVMAIISAGFVAACVAGFVRLFYRRRARRYSMMLFVMLGSLGSSVFLPTWIGEGLQMHTGVFAFVPCAIALGLTAVRTRHRAPALKGLLVTGIGFPAFFAVLIVLTVLSPNHAPTDGCTDDVARAAVMPSTRIHITSLDEPPLSNNIEFLSVHNMDLVHAIEVSSHPGDIGAVIYDACLGKTRIGFGAPAVIGNDDEFHSWHLRPTSRDRKVVIVTRPGEDGGDAGAPDGGL